MINNIYYIQQQHLHGNIKIKTFLLIITDFIPLQDIGLQTNPYKLFAYKLTLTHYFLTNDSLQANFLQTKCLQTSYCKINN